MRYFFISKHLFTYIILYVLIMLLVCIFEYNPIFYSILFCITNISSIYIVWISSKKQISLFLLFLITFGLFIGGRFYATLLGSEKEIFEPTFFANYIVSNIQKLNTFLFVLNFMFLSSLGYFLINSSKYKPLYIFSIKKKDILVSNLITKYIFPILAITTLITSYQKYKLVANKGYLYLYSHQGEAYSGGHALIPIIITLFLAHAIAYGDKNNKIKYIILFGINSILSILMGTRASFGAFLLTLIWIISFYKKISLKKLMIYGFFSLVLLLILFSFSVRSISSGVDKNFLSPIVIFREFLYNQGISLMVFDVSKMIKEYPLLAYIQSFIPGSSIIYSLLTGKLLSTSDVSFASFLSNTLNNKLYLHGNGLGWTLLSDLYLFSGRISFFFGILSIFFGIIIGILDRLSRNYKFYLYLSAAIALRLLILPRSGLNTIIPFVFYTFAFIFIIIFLSDFLRIKK